jgi:hypothetical protein
MGATVIAPYLTNFQVMSIHLARAVADQVK